MNVDIETLHERRRELGMSGPARPKVSFRTLLPGESVFFPRKTASDIATKYVDHKPMKFRARTVVCGGVHGVRVWRIA